MLFFFMSFFFQTHNQGFMRNRLTVNLEKIPVFTVVSKHIMDPVLLFCGILFNFYGDYSLLV